MEDEADQYLTMLKEVTTERDEALLLIGDMMTVLQDYCDLLSEQPADSERPFIIGARARLAAFIEKHKIKTGPEVLHG